MSCLFKYCVIVFFFAIVAGNSFSQTANESSYSNNKNDNESEKWGLNKYVWSHVNYKTVNSDKVAIDFDAVKNWESLSKYIAISNNGKYTAYSIEKQGIADSLVIQSIDNAWRKVYTNSYDKGFFSADNLYYIFQSKEGLCILKLGSEEIRIVRNVVPYSLCINREDNYIAYQLQNQELIIENIGRADQKKFVDILKYDFSPSGRWLIAEQKNTSIDLIVYDLINKVEKKFSTVKSYSISSNGESMLLFIGPDLKYLDMISGDVKTIWSQKQSIDTVGFFVLDAVGDQVSMILSRKMAETAELSDPSIWYWKKGMNEAELKINSKTIEQNMAIVPNSCEFAGNGRYLKFDIQNTQIPVALSKTVPVEVWGYRDSIIQSGQSKQFKSREVFVNLETGLVFQVNELEECKQIKNDCALVIKSGNMTAGDRYWKNSYYEDSCWIVSLKNGLRKLLPTKSGENIWFAPSGDYLLCYDGDKSKNYFSYNTRTGHIVNISNLASDKSHKIAEHVQPKKSKGIAEWLEGMGAILVYDDFDIWLLNLEGKKLPINITNGFGKRNEIQFTLMNSDRFGAITPESPFFNDSQTLLLRAFNNHNKWNGFYKKMITAVGDPELLNMEPALFSAFQYTVHSINGGMIPLKAAEAKVWIVKKETAKNAPNYFVTADFKTYKRISNLEPEKSYNWLTSELHSFRQLDGTVSRGVLYKPENFDPTKKYPVIVSFYFTVSDQFFNYLKPEYIFVPTIHNMPAWMVSHGYLVFAPDVHFTETNWGPNVINAMDGAAKYLGSLSYVDSKSIAAVGHSNSGRFGYYLLTHSNSFAAICTGSAATDVISKAFKNDYWLHWVEKGALGGGLGKLWENKNIWYDHTAVLNADKVTAPSLFFDNQKDGDGPFAAGQAMEMYMALWRLEKKNWWLNYRNSGHHARGDDAKDFTIRYTQFFDHYLKKAPAPKWMTNGLPAKLVGLETRFQLDAEGSCALKGKTTCNVCYAWNQQYHRNPLMFKKPMAEWSLDKDIKDEMDKDDAAGYKENMKGQAQRVKENNAKLKGTWKGEKY
ncbi:MAG: prolyl oligopeptidase family serine peptidase [Chitinophagaceae bacterium]